MTIDIWFNRQVRSYIGITAHSFQIKNCTMLCWLGDDRNPQLQDRASNFEIINKQIFSVAERMFKPDRCHLTVKDLKPWCLSTVTKILNIDHFCLIIFKVFVAVE